MVMATYHSLLILLRRSARSGSNEALMHLQRTIVLGGSRSGKSNFAEALVRCASPPWYYIATAQAFDTEMAERIGTHQDRRGPDWRTIEAPLEVPEALTSLPRGATVLLDCATLWLSNHMLAGHDVAAESDRLAEAMRAFPGHIVTVSNEVGFGLVPETKLGRQFRDAQGILNQRLAAEAELAVLVVAGLPLALKGTLP